MPNYNRTSHYIDVDAIRELIATEVGIRGVSNTEIFEQTGVGASSLGRFMGRNQTLTGDALVSLIKWAGGDVNRYIKRRRTVTRHTDTFEQRKLRVGAAYLKSQNIDSEPGETSVDTLLRLLATAKQNGFLS